MDDLTKLTPLVPENPLETALVAARKGEIPLAEFLSKLLDSDVAVPSATEVQADGSGFSPVAFEKDGTGMVAVFSSLERASKVGEHAQYALTINARSFFGMLLADVGVVLNPGFDEGIDVSPDGVARLLRDFPKDA